MYLLLCVCTCVCLPVSLLPHIQAFLTQEDLDMSLSVSTKTLDILNRVILYASGLVVWWYHSGGWPVVRLQGCSQLKVPKKSVGQSFVSECSLASYIVYYLICRYYYYFMYTQTQDSSRKHITLNFFFLRCVLVRYLGLWGCGWSVPVWDGGQTVSCVL